MRTTVTLDPDVERLVRDVMRERGLSFKQALNEALRRDWLPKDGPSGLRSALFGWERARKSVGIKR